MWGRKNRPSRRQINAEAWITQQGDFAARRCKVLDVSPSGAKLQCADERFLKPMFHLKFSRDERAGKLCKVVWRKGSTVGVEFQK